MQEQLISYETAKLAKEAGFDWPTLYYAFDNFQAGQDYIIVDELNSQFGLIVSYENHNQKNHWTVERYSLPSQSLLQKWIREVHDIDFSIQKSNVPLIWLGIESDDYRPMYVCVEALASTYYSTYEECLEEHLKLRLQWILAEKKK